MSDLEDCAQAAARMLKLLASEQRLLLLCRLVDGEASVGVLAEHARLAQSAASQHLAKMRAEGLVATRRDAQTIFYRLADPAAMRVLEALFEIYGGGRQDRGRTALAQPAPARNSPMSEKRQQATSTRGPVGAVRR